MLYHARTSNRGDYRGILGLFRGRGPLGIDSPEAFTELDPECDPADYTRFLNEARLIARVVIGESERDHVAVERLVAMGISEDEAFDMVLAAKERQTEQTK